ncbi:MAG: penicillin amidase [Bacteroidetes bacterium SW_9_63_38]|nr:MAG: penicillin amidase [Bacteroidetes bacterium SW_9_63_38]
MSRSLRLGLGFSTVLLGGVLTWWIVSTPSPYTSPRPVTGLSDSVRIHWTEASVPVIEADSAAAAVTALGYTHGLNRGWTATLWQQTALGRLSEWFGTGVLPLDRHVRRLGLARHARTAYESLPASRKRILRAYAQGMNAALQTRTVRNSDAFILLDVRPRSWAPWHTLLVQRLLAWVGTSPLTPPPDAPSAVEAFTETDRTLRRWLHLHGWSRSVAWAAHPGQASDTTRPALFQRHMLGASALPIVQEAIWQQPNGPRRSWATLPGTLLFPTGTSPSRAWASLLHSRRQLRRVPFDSSALTDWYERLDPTGADEQLVRVERLNTGLPLAPTAASRNVDSMRVPAPAADTIDRTTVPVPDTAWTVQWPGFSTESDLGAWLRRGSLSPRDAAASTFTLFAADGLGTTADGSWQILGTPPVTVTGPHTAVVGRSVPWTRFQARALRSHLHGTDSVRVAQWAANDSSAWAAQLLPHVEPSLRRLSEQSRTVGNTATYVRNWNHRYDAQSIGALLFEEWMRAYSQELGHVPTLRDTSTYFADYRLRQAFRQALDTLRTQLGPDARLWRWERRAQDRRFFPVWSADSLVDASLQELRSTRYAPLTRTGRGHPSTLAGGPSLVDPLPIGPAPDTWEGWMTPGGPLTVRRHRYAPSRTFARSRLETERPVPRTLSGPETGRSMWLIPTLE